MTHWNQKHGYALPGRITSVYRSWLSAKARCYNPNATQFRYYGGRGITMYPEWRDDFTAFLRDVGPKPQGATLERIDNDGHYEPGNVRWATKAEQNRNTRKNVRLTIWGQTRIIAEWARLVGIDPSRIHQRLNRAKWTPSQAVFHGLMAARRHVGTPILTALLLLLSAGPVLAQAGFLQAIPGTARPTCTSITAPVTNATWCADASGAPNTYLWKVWNGTTYVTVGGGGGGGGAVSLNAQLWATFPNQTFANDANVTISSGGGVHTLGWSGCLPVSRGGTGLCSGIQDALPFFITPSQMADSGVFFNAPSDTTTIAGNATIVGTTSQLLQVQYSATPELLVQNSLVTLQAPTALVARGGVPSAFAWFSNNGQSATLAAKPSATGSWSCRWPDTSPNPGDTLSNSGGVPCQLVWAPSGTGTVTGTGAATQIGVWTSATNLTGFSDFIWDDANGKFDVGNSVSDTGAGSNIILGRDNTTDGSDIYILSHNNFGTGFGTSDSAVVGTNNTFSGAGTTFILGDFNDATNCGSCTAVGAFNSVGPNGSNFAFGVSNDSLAGGGSGMAFGNSNVDTSGGGSMMFGINNTDASAGSSLIYGSNNSVSGAHGSAMLVGQNLSSQASNSLSLGVSVFPEITITGNLVELGVIGQPSVVLQFNGSTSGSTSLKAAAAPTPTTFSLPTADGSNGDCLVTDGAGQLAFSNTCAGGSGITSLNGLSAAVQTVSPGSTNINWSSAVSTHTFTWTGQLSPARGGTGQDTSAWSALPLVTAGTWSQYAGSTCPGGQAATSISASGVLTCAAAGTGNVTHTGNLTAGQVVVGNGTNDIHVFNATDKGVFFATTGGQLFQDPFFNYDNTKHTLILGTSATPAAQPWGTPPLFSLVNLEVGSPVGGTGPKLTLQSSNGTLAAPTISATNDILGTVAFSGYDGSNGITGATIKTMVAGPPGSGFVPTQIDFAVTGTGGASNLAMSLLQNGDLRLGRKLRGYNGLGATSGALLIGNGASGEWDANTLTAGPGISISNGAGTIQISGTGGPPGAPTGSVQFNAAGAFGGDSNFVWDNATKRLGLGTGSPATQLQLTADITALGLTYTTAGPRQIVTEPGSTFYDPNGGLFRPYQRYVLNDLTDPRKTALYIEDFTNNPTVFTVSSLVRSGTTATATTSSNHGYASGDIIAIRGATPAGYNLNASIVVTGLSTFTYTVSGALTTPATGSITAQKFLVTSGIVVNHYAPPDNGGEVSGIYVSQYGGGNAISIFKVSNSGAPGGLTTYPNNGFAAEIQSIDSPPALFVVTGNSALGSAVSAGQAANFGLGASASKGILVFPTDGSSFNNREAIAIGNPNFGSANAAQKWQVLMSGNTGIGDIADTGIKLTITDTTSNGANIKLIGDGVSTPNKFIRAKSGFFQVMNSAYSAPILTINDGGTADAPGGFAVNSVPGLSVTITVPCGNLQFQGGILVNKGTC